MLTQFEKAAQFLSLHQKMHTFIMPNAWDAGSAKILAAQGFSAIATTSAGIAFSHGLPDYEGALTREEMLNSIERVVRAVDLPVSADLESGYGESAEDVAQTIRLAIATGIVGGNIEDYTGDKARPLFDIQFSVERIRAARLVADEMKMPFTLTARTDAYLLGLDNAFAQAVQRCNLYAEAGASCLFVPGVSEPKVIAELVKEVNGPLTVVMGLKGNTLTVAQLTDLGVRRISIGGSLARVTYGLMCKAAQEMLIEGTFDFAQQQIPDDELCTFFANYPQTRGTTSA